MSASSGTRRPATAAIVLVLVGGLVLAGSGTGTWVVDPSVREVAGVEIEEVVVVAGTEVAGAVLPLGLAAALLGLLLALVRGAVQRALGWVAALTGAGALVAVAVGAWRAAALPGEVAGTVPVAGAAAIAVAAGGLLAARQPAHRPALGDRYTLEGGDADDDWALGSSDEPPPEHGA